jgi:hypothetical protein
LGKSTQTVGRVETWKLNNSISNRNISHSTKGFDLNHLKSILDTLNRIKSFRNRIGHHDSIMRIPEPIAGHPDFYPRTVNQMINSLKILLLSLLDLVRDIDPQCSLAIEQSKNWKSFFYC